MPAQIGQRFFKSAAHGIERLVHVLEIRRIQTLKANEHALTSAAHQQFEKFLIVRGVDARLAHPANSKRNQCAKKFLRLCHVRRDVVVHEEEKFSLVFHLFDLGDDGVNWTARLRGIEDRLHGAEIAFEMAAASSLDQADGQITLAAKNGAVGLQVASAGRPDWR